MVGDSSAQDGDSSALDGDCGSQDSSDVGSPVTLLADCHELITMLMCSMPYTLLGAR